MNTVLINTAAEAYSDQFTFANRDSKNNTLFAQGLGVGETVTVQFTTDNGSNWTNAAVNASAVTMTSTNNVMFLNVVGRFRLYKAATVGVVKVTLVTEDD